MIYGQSNTGIGTVGMSEVPTPRENSEFDQVQTELVISVSNLENLLMHLASRLTPILQDKPEKDASNSATQQTVYSPVGRCISEQTMRLRQHERIVASLISRLAI